MDADPPEPSRQGMATRIIELPQRMLLSVVAAGVMGGLALGAASVWFAARFGPSRRR